MQISLNQNEIEAGIKMYIESRGINLHGREVAMDFTAQRKGNAGINVDVDLGEDSFFSPSETEAHTRPVHQGQGSNGTVVTLTPSGGVSAKRTPAPVVEKAAEPVEQAAPEEPVKRTRKAKVEAVEPEAAAEPEVKEEAAPVEEPVSELAQPQPETVPMVANPNSLFGGATVASIPAVKDSTTDPVEPVMSKSLFG